VIAGRPPRVWLMMGRKAGDNAQIMALAESLGWPFEIKHLVFRRTELITNLLAGPTLTGVVTDQSSPLLPPWPDLMISAGRRNEPACRWVRAQAGGDVRLVHVGRPWAPLECFDLIVTTPQYRLPKSPNVLQNVTPLQRVTEARLAEAAQRWAPRLAHLSQPYVAVMIGGNAGPYVLDGEAGALLGRAASAFAKRAGGSLLISTSARSPEPAIGAFGAAIDVPAEIFRWRRDAADNPYLGYLALAGSVIVTCESMSMLAEACATRKPVHMFDLDTGPDAKWPLLADLLGEVQQRSWQRRLRRLKFQPLVYRIAMVTGPRRLTRDVRIIQQQLIAAGRAVWLGQSFPDGPPLPPLDDVARAVTAVKALFGEQADEALATDLRVATRALAGAGPRAAAS
jgi:mitochondrial fission protein ELM1